LGKYILKRILWMIPVLIGVIVIVFTIAYFTPGDPVMNILGAAGYTPERYAAKQAELGLDKPYIVQLLTYIWKLTTRLDFGKSFGSAIPISSELANRLPITVRLNLLSLVLMVAIGLPLGMISALKQYSVLDVVLTSLALLAAAIPGFVMAVLAALIFAVYLKWLPLTGLADWKAWILPVACSALPGMAVYIRFTRTTMLEVIRQDYIRTARAKGLAENVVVRKHALKNCMIPISTVIGTFVANMFSGAIIVETVYAIPGMGMYLLQGINSRDYPIIVGVVFCVSLLVSIVNLLVDIFYAFIDPRIRAQYVSPKTKKELAAKLMDSKRSIEGAGN